MLRCTPKKNLWIIQLDAHSGNKWMENNIQNLLQTFLICCDAIWPYQFTCCLSTFDERFFCEYLDDFIVCYIDDILIFSKNMEDHEHHLHFVLEKIRKFGFCTKLEKCDLHQFEMKLLGYVFIEIAFTCILIRFRPLFIGLF